jgi:hypothetical protein
MPVSDSLRFNHRLQETLRISHRGGALEVAGLQKHNMMGLKKHSLEMPEQ